MLKPKIMKRLLLFSILSLFCLTISAQTNTWISSNGDWSTASKWSLNVVPTSNHDVVIPAGASINLDIDGYAKSITVQGNAIFNFTNGSGRKLSFTNASSFSAESTLNWTYGTMRGGGTLTLNGTTVFTAESHKFITEGTTIINNGILNYQGSGRLYISDGILTNASTGIIDLQTANGNIVYSETGSHIFNNEGLIRRTGSGRVDISAEFHNNGGTISVEGGTLFINGLKSYLTNGTYSVASGSTFQWNTEIECAGTLTGAPIGEIVVSTASINIPANTTANFNFTGEKGIILDYVDAIKGGGTLVNKANITFRSDANKFIRENTTLVNEGVFNYQGSGRFYIFDGIITNTSTGIIDFQTAGGDINYNGSDSHIFTNSGLIKRTGEGRVNISAEFHNNGGTISVEGGTLFLNGLKSYLTNGTYSVASGATFQWNTEIECAGTLTGALTGEIVVSTASINIPANTTANFNFTGNKGIILDYVDAIKGGGTLVNIGKMTFSGESNKFIRENTTIINESVINYQGSGRFYIIDGILTNTSTGIIDFQTAGGDINYNGSGSHIFNNAGLIKRTGEGRVNISAELHNNGGVISVEGGTLFINGLKSYLTDGTYNVASDAIFRWNTEIECAGTLTGETTGEIFVSTASINIPENTTASFNFTGNKGIILDYVDAIKGAGTLVNIGKMTFSGDANKFITENTTLRNEGVINNEGTGNTYLSNGTLINAANGIIDLQTAGGGILKGSGDIYNFNNSGVVKRSTAAGKVTISVATTNSGIIDVQTGELEFSGSLGFHNTTDGVVMGTGTLILPSSAPAFTNDGIFSAGGSPGILTVVRDFNSAPTSKLQIEIFGKNQGTEYDLLTIQGNAIMNGTIEVGLNYAADVNDEFVILTANSINSCNLPASVTAHYNNHNYTFDVMCNPDNVTLKVSSIILGTEENPLSNLSLYPNPTNGNFAIDLGKEYPDVTIQIYNLLGQVISAEKYASARIIENQIDNSPGIYFVKVNTATGESTTLQMIKQ
jgi:hypothetical protein